MYNYIHVYSVYITYDFRGYVEGAASAVLSGGRYDNLLRRMGKPGGALGFAVYLDRLEAMPASPADYDADTLVCWAEDGDAALAIRTAERLRSRGETVRLERTPPKTLRWRRALRAEKGRVTEC